ncbi:hypothetical protein HZA57_09870 [Candidatus Poribacteria bacterium]|nr:hypothetical protein [Candidatus Poribacteria bacterium]
MAEDYVESIARFFGFAGSLWSLETLQDQQAPAIDRRIIPLAALAKKPRPVSS